MFAIFLCALFYIAQASRVITIYGDVYKDKEFFIRTLPWIVDNIGGEISMDFNMQGSGRYTVPQMCALSELRANTFLQAQYLKCEAEERPSQYCLCETAINPETFKHCVAHGSHLAAISSEKFQQVGVDVTPLIELSYKSTVFGVQDSWYLKKICTIFGDIMPRGCVKPFACNGTEALQNGKALAQFDKNCESLYSSWSDVTSTTAFTLYDRYA